MDDSSYLNSQHAPPTYGRRGEEREEAKKKKKKKNNNWQPGSAAFGIESDDVTGQLLPRIPSGSPKRQGCCWERMEAWFALDFVWTRAGMTGCQLALTTTFSLSEPRGEGEVIRESFLV